MDKLNFQDGTLVSPAKVTIDNVEHTVTPAVYSGSTPLSAYALNQLQSNIEKAVNTQNVTTANTDLNDYTTEGRYYFETNVTPQNVPTGVVNGFLEVFRIGNWVKQVWYRAGTMNINDYETYVRTCVGTTWSDWKRFTVDKDDLLIYRGVVPVDDLNDLKDPGIYYTATKTLNNVGIENYEYSFIVVLGISTRGYIVQALIRPCIGVLMTREFSGSPLTWHAWESYMTDEVAETTLTLGNYFDTVDINRVAKVGKVVQVSFRAHTKTAIPNDTIFSTLPYKTKLNFTIPIYTSGRYALAEPQFSYTTVNSNGWRCGAIATDKWIQASFTYITSD